ncbi:MAG: hypothetical protein GF341_10880 [candidate division Zixibacteria bacterium]|nr:hypothetical protein [candidate division Zixibacteria bacterium]
MRLKVTVLATLLVAMAAFAFAPAVNAQEPAIPAACEPMNGVLLGDQNGDGFLDAVDLNLLIGVIFFNGKEWFIGTSDHNGDTFADAVDLNLLISELFFNGNHAAPRTTILKGRVGAGRWYLVKDDSCTYQIGDDAIGVFAIGEDGTGLLDCANCPKTDSLYIPLGLTVTGGPSLAAPSAFIVRRSGYVHAVGTSSAPVVFTSSFAEGDRLKGDWGGFVINGCAYNNAVETGFLIQAEGDGGLGGGTCDEDNSGCYKYIRVQFAGREFTLDNELNGITLNSVGGGTPVDAPDAARGVPGGTTFEFIQILQNDDDGIEWFGGTVNAKNCVVAGVKDDGFDSDWGAEWRGQHLIVVRDPDGTKSSGHNGFEWDNSPESPADQPCPRMKPTVYQVTLVGDGCATEGTWLSGDRHQSMHVRRAADADINNCVATEWAEGLEFDNQSGAFTLKECQYPVRHDSTNVGLPNADSLIEVNHSIYYNIGFPSHNTGGGSRDVSNSYEGHVMPLGTVPSGVPSGNAASTNVIFIPGDSTCVEGNNPIFVNGLWPSGAAGNPWVPDFTPNPGDPTGMGIDTPGALPPNDGFFDQVDHKGAVISGNNWLAGWTLFRRD